MEALRSASAPRCVCVRPEMPVQLSGAQRQRLSALGLLQLHVSAADGRQEELKQMLPCCLQAQLQGPKSREGRRSSSSSS